MVVDDSTTLRDSMAEDENLNLKGFGSKAVHSGTNHVGDAVNTPNLFNPRPTNLPMKDMLGGRKELNILCFMPEFLL